MSFLLGLDEFKLSNQNGRSIDISPSDTRILTSAMILHEKAKNLMKSKDYLKALILLAEADNEFKYLISLFCFKEQKFSDIIAITI